MQAPSKSIFLSYRREDSEEVVDRIYDTLSEEFSREALFRDLDDIAPGQNFPVVVRQTLRACDVVLVFIGRDWLTLQAEGQPRLLDPSDHVRMEVLAALGHPNAQTIPVLVKRAAMPLKDQLPPALAPLSNLNALTVRSAGRDYQQDMRALIGAIAQGVERSAQLRRDAAAGGQLLRSPAAVVGGSSIAPLSEESWRLLLVALDSDSVTVVCGSEFGTDPALGDGADREAPMAALVAAALALPAPPTGRRRPLAELAARCYSDGRRDEFARALRDAASASFPVVGLDALHAVEPLHIFLTAAVDRCLEIALASQRGASVASEAYSVAEPGRLDRIDIGAVPALVFHVAGAAEGLDGDAGVTDGDWLRFAREWHTKRPHKLSQLFKGRAVLFLGGGYPRGFVEFWVGMARELKCRSLWVAASAIEGDVALPRFLKDEFGSEVVLFDDAGGALFLNELARRWEHRVVSAPMSLPPEALGEEAASLLSAPIIPLTRTLHFGLSPQNPWRGLESYYEQDAAFFLGRQVEVEHLVHALRSYPLTVLLAPSGMGKTSLIQAGVAPVLRMHRAIPVVIRLSWLPDDKPVREQVLQAVAEVSPVQIPGPQPDESLWSFFHRKASGASGALAAATGTSPAAEARSPFVLIFDQFEEIFTMSAASDEGQQRARVGWRDLADLVEGRVPTEIRERFNRNPNLVAEYDFRAVAPAVLLSLREDFMAQMVPLATQMPSLWRSTVRLGGLGREAALKIVLGAGAGHFTPEAATEVVRFLQGDGTADGLRSPFEDADINPALLATVCFHLNEDRKARGLAMVDASLVAARQNDLLDRFYQETLRDLNPAARQWVEDELITAVGHRNSIDLDSARASLQARGVAPEVLEQLVDRRLLRLVAQGKGVRVELTHDLLADAARQRRDAKSAR